VSRFRDPTGGRRKRGRFSSSPVGVHALLFLSDCRGQKERIIEERRKREKFFAAIEIAEGQATVSVTALTERRRRKSYDVCVG